MTTQTCHRCGSNIVVPARFCSACGEPASAPAAVDATRIATASLLAQNPRPQTLIDSVRTNIVRAGRTLRGQPEPSVSRECVMLVVDVSGSMGSPFDGQSTKLEAAVEAGCALIGNKARIDASDQVGIVSFSDTAELEAAPAACGAHKSELCRVLQDLSIAGGTDIDAGLEAAERALDWGPGGGTRRIVLLTDGQDSGRCLVRAASMKARGAVLDVIGVGQSHSEVDEKLLRTVASVVAGQVRYRFIKDRQTLVTHYTLLANKTQLAS